MGEFRGKEGVSEDPQNIQRPFKIELVFLKIDENGIFVI